MNQDHFFFSDLFLETLSKSLPSRTLLTVVQKYAKGFKYNVNIQLVSNVYSGKSSSNYVNHLHF